jgi:glutaconyl-CoA/methylmalonyl-CoA decarboxylase subunit gamma
LEIAGSIPILPPMPGRVVELRVHDGEAVAKGAVLLVLEAMKMRNEVTAPADGVVRDVRVREGANVRARETMLVLVPKAP